MKTGLIFLAVAVVAMGCSRQRALDPSAFVAVPGLGIPDVVALGMTVREIQGATGAIISEQPSGRYWCDIPHLGISFSGFRNRERLTEGITFCIVPKTNTPSFRFRGSLS